MAHTLFRTRYSDTHRRGQRSQSDDVISKLRYPDARTLRSCSPTRRTLHILWDVDEAYISGMFSATEQHLTFKRMQA